MANIYKLNELNVEELLKEEGFTDLFIKRHSIKFHYVITRILYKYYRIPKDVGNGKVQLNMRSLEMVLGQCSSTKFPDDFKKKGNRRYLIALIKELLIKWDVIIQHTIHETINGSIKSRAMFKIKDEWYSKGFTLIKEDIPSNFKYKLATIKEENESNFNGIYLELYNQFKTITIDKDEAIAYLDKLLSNPQLIKMKDKADKYGHWHERIFDRATHSFYSYVVNEFEANRFFCVDVKTGRIYSSITNLPSSLRQFLRDKNDNKITEIDIANCQPYLLNKIADTDSLFKELTRKGEFYNYVKEYCINKNIKVSDNFKIDMFSSVFFGKNKTLKKMNKYEKVFQELFPITHFSLRCLKMKNYKELSKLLQTKEAELIISGVCKDYLKDNDNTTIATIHDAILIPENEVDKINGLINKYFYLNIYSK